MIDEFTPTIPDPRPDPVSDDLVNMYLPQYNLANQALEEKAIQANAYRLKVGEELLMRQELYLKELQATAESRKGLLSKAIDAGDVPFAESLMKRDIPTIPLGLVTEVATAESGAAIKMSDTPEFPVGDQDIRDNAIGLALNNALGEVFAKLPQFAGDKDTDKVVKNAKAVGLWTAYLGQLFIPLWYSATKSREGSVIKDTLLPGTQNREESAAIWKKLQSTDLNEIDSAVQEWKAGIEAKFPDNPVALISAVTEALLTSQDDNADAIRVFAKKNLVVNGETVPSLLPEIWEPDSVLDLEFDSTLYDEWFQNSLNMLDVAFVGSAVKAVPKIFMKIAGQKAAARLAASEAVRVAGTGDKATGYMTSLRANDLEIIPEVQAEIDKKYALADAALNDRIIVNRVDALTGKPVEKVLRSFEGEYGKRLISAKFVQGAGDTQVEVLVGSNRGRGYASLKAAEKANERSAGVYEVVDGKTLGLDGYFLKASRSVDESGWLRGADTAELAKGNQAKAGWFLPMWKRGAWGNESDFGRYFWSPAVTAIHRSTVEAVSSSLEKAKMGAVVEEILTPIQKLSRGKQNQLGEIIQYGKLQPSRLDPAETGKWFDYGELDRLYLTKYGRNVTNEEANAYYSYKVVSDLAHTLANETERSKMLAAGAETWTLKNHAYPSIIGRKVSDISEDFPVLLPDGRVVLRGELTAADMKNFDLIEAYGQAEYNGTRFGHVLVDRKTSFTGGLQRNIIGYTEGGTRNYADVWFVKQRATRQFGDKKIARSPITHGIFRTKQEGAKYVQTMNEAVAVYKSYLSDVARAERSTKGKDRTALLAKTETALQELDPTLSISKMDDLVAKGELDLDHPLEVVYDREMMSGFEAPNWERLKTYQRGGKMYYSERGQHLLQDGEPAPLVDPYVALSNQIGSMVHQNAYRNFAIREVGEWGATFGKNYDVPGVAFPAFDEILKHGVWKMENTPEMNKLRNLAESQRMYVKRILMQPGQSDIYIAQAKSRLAQKLAASLGDNQYVPDAFRTGKIITETSAVRGLRTLAYDLALGFFNVGQLAVQGSAAITATLIHPIHGAGAIKDFGLIRMAAAAEYNPKMIAILDKRLSQSKFFGFKAGEYTKLVEDYRRSGLHLVGRTDSTLDRSSAVSGKGVNTAWQQIREKLRMPLYEGERIGRIVSYGIARREALEGVQAGKFLEGSPEYYQFIQKTTNKYTLNMMSGMETWWQRNQLTQLPLQFFQYPFKYMEVFLGMNKEFTEAERWRFILGHMMLYGAYGVPLGPEAVKGAVLPGYEAAFGKKPSEDEYENIMLGLMDTAIGKMTGSETAAASTFGSGNFVGEFIKDIYGDNSPIGLSGGIALNSLNKIGGVVKDTAQLFYAVASYESLHNASPVLISEASDMLMTDLGNVVRSMSNANKAYFLTKYGVLRDNRGGAIENDSGYNAFLVAMGIRSNLEWKQWDAIESKKSKESRLQDVAGKIAQLQREGELARRDGDMDKARRKLEVAAALYSGLDFKDGQEVLKLVQFFKTSDVEGFLDRNKDSLRYEQTGEQ